MAQRDIEALKRRAAVLIERSPAAREVIEFYANMVENGVAWGDRFQGPEPLAKAAAALDPEVVRFFTRIAIRNAQYAAAGAASRCPQCGSLPQLGVLRPEGHGAALHLACSTCLHEWPHRRDACPSCAKPELVFFTAEQFPHMQVQACDSCKCYLHLIDLGKEPFAIPELDELAALPLDIWAQERGYRKIQPNLAGI